MNRRRLLTTAAGALASAAAYGRSVVAEEREVEPGSLYKIVPGAEINLHAASIAVGDRGAEFSMVRLGRCKLILDDQDRLTAIVNASVTQFTKIDYWISLAVFDEQNKFLGAATHKEAIESFQVSKPVTLLSEFSFDFGISKAYKSAAQMALAISEPDLSPPDTG